MKKITVPFFRLSPVEEEIEEVAKVMRSGWLTTAKKTNEFEMKFAEYVGAKHALAVNSGTAALHLALEALGIRQGDTVVAPVHTFTATAEVIRYLGGEVIFADIDRDTFCIDLTDARRRIDEKRLTTHVREEKKGGHIPDEAIPPKAIIPVHFGGHPCDMDEVMRFARDFRLKVVEDSAHALPCMFRWNGRGGEASKIGSIGDITCFSFYANKTITTGEGGMVTTNDDFVAKRIKVMRLHGIDRDIWDRYQSDKPSWYYEVVAPGFKYNLTDIAAAIGIKQLKRCDEFHEKRVRIASFYLDSFRDLQTLRVPRIKCDMNDHSWHLFVILLDSVETSERLDRNEFIQRLADLGVSTSVHYIPLHFQPYYRQRYGLKPEDFPNSTWVYERCVSLPIFPDMRDDEVEYVAACVRKILDR